jgi:hypothetical protein
MHCGAAGEIGRFLSTPDALRFARCGGRALLDAFSRELETIDIGRGTRFRYFSSSDISAADAALRAVVARSPRVRSLVLSHQTWISLDTFCNEEIGSGNRLECDFCELQRLARLGLRSCFRLTSSCIRTLLDRCTSLRELDVSSIALGPYDVKDFCQYTDTLCVNYTSLHPDPRGDETFPDLRTILASRSWRPGRTYGGSEGHVLTCLELYDYLGWHPGLDDAEEMHWAHTSIYPSIIARIREAAPNLKLAFRTDTERFSYYFPADLDDRVSELIEAWSGDSDDESQEEPADDAESDADGFYHYLSMIT